MLLSMVSALAFPFNFLCEAYMPATFAIGMIWMRWTMFPCSSMYRPVEANFGTGSDNRPEVKEAVVEF